MLTGNRCECPTCGEVFRSTAAFDKHRTGKHGIDRRCMTTAEMVGRGMAKAKSGWVTQPSNSHFQSRVFGSCRAEAGG